MKPTKTLLTLSDTSEYESASQKVPFRIGYAELLKWLKTEYGLGHGHANAIILYIQDPKLAKRKLAEDSRKAE